jgi:hypothetical protein
MTAPVHDCADVRLSLGAYVLGSLEPADRSIVEHHLADCPSCSAEVSQLAVLPGLLGRLTVEQVTAEPPTAPPSGLERLLSAAADHRRRTRRLRLWSAAAILILFVGIATATLTLVTGGHSDHPRVVATRTTSELAGVNAHATLTAKDWGTAVDLRLSGVLPGEHCRLLVQDRSGTWEPSASWVASYEGDATVPAATSVSTANISQMKVVTEQGQTLATLVPQA